MLASEIKGEIYHLVFEFLDSIEEMNGSEAGEIAAAASNAAEQIMNSGSYLIECTATGVKMGSSYSFENALDIAENCGFRVPGANNKVYNSKNEVVAMVFQNGQRTWVRGG